MRETAKGVVVQHPNLRSCKTDHERASHIATARRIAALQNYEFSNEYTLPLHAQDHTYFVPDDTLTWPQAQSLGIESEQDFFGGIVPYDFIATKTITHPLVDQRAHAPEGWCHDLSRKIGSVVLAGYTTFTAADARWAVTRMLERGPVRLKPARGIGGNGQIQITSSKAFEDALSALEHEPLFRDGLVIEQNLEEVTTYSVGHVRIANRQIAYCGTQRLTRTNSNELAYGGSSLLAARGDLASLLRHKLPLEMRSAIAYARHYDAAVTEEFPELRATRRNYDVIHGKDFSDEWQTGVLEQSWRIGGASPAELGAFEAFDADPQLNLVRTFSVEAYGPHRPPAHAKIHFAGVDGSVGQITKYSYTEKYENPA